MFFLYAFLYTASCDRVENAVKIQVTGEVAYNKISTPNGIEYLSKLFSKISGEEITVRVSVKGEEKEEVKEGFSIKDLAEKKSAFGDKIDIV